MLRILLIDDHPLYRHGFIAALQARMPGVAINGAANAAEGLANLDQHPDTDLVIVDFRLPDTDGLATLERCAARHPLVPRVLISGDEDVELARRALAAGAAGFIPKSLGVDEVERALRLVLDGGIYVRQQMPIAPRGGLTLRQLEVLQLLREGRTNREIAHALHITERTAKAHVSAIFEALSVDNRTQAVIAAQRAGLL